MLASRIKSLPQRLVAFDLETYAFRHGVLAPDMVCGSAGWLERGPTIAGLLLDKPEVDALYLKLLEDPDAVIGTANGAFDNLVMAVRFAKFHGVDIMPKIFASYAAGRQYDLQHAEALNAVADGHLGRDPRTGGELKDPVTGKRGRYSVSICVDLTLGRQDAKANDEYRLRYGELDGIPIAQWPPAARDYPVDDGRNEAEAILAQAGHLPKTTGRHTWGPQNGGSACLSCGATKMASACTSRRPHRNLHDLSNQVWSAFALHCGDAWGFCVDQKKVDVVERHALRRRANLIQPFIDRGVYRADGSQDRALLKRMIAESYGAKNPCPYCEGTGKVEHWKVATLQCKACKGRSAPWKGRGKINEPTVASCVTCNNTGRVRHPVQDTMTCGVRDDETHKIETITCDGTGLVLPDSVPRSDSEAIAFGRDALFESDDVFLMSLGEFLLDAKVLKDYVPFLRSARYPLAGHGPDCDYSSKKEKKKRVCSCPGPYVDGKLLLRSNVILETGRVSYGGYIMLLPRAPGFIDDDTKEYVPSIRECIVATGQIPRTYYRVVPDDHVLAANEERVDLSAAVIGGAPVVAEPDDEEARDEEEEEAA